MNAGDPGLAPTKSIWGDLQDRGGGVVPALRHLWVRVLGTDAERAAAPILYAATSADVEAHPIRGKYFTSVAGPGTVASSAQVGFGSHVSRAWPRRSTLTRLHGPLPTFAVAAR